MEITKALSEYGSIAGGAGSVGVSLYFSYKMLLRFIDAIEKRDKLFIETIGERDRTYIETLKDNTHHIAEVKDVMRSVYEQNRELLRNKKIGNGK